MSTFYELYEESYRNSKEHGFWDAPDPEGMMIPMKLALIHSEVSEALEDNRKGKHYTTYRADGKPEGFPSELADIVIRVMDLARHEGIDLEWEIRAKQAFNKTRPMKHGKSY